MSRAWCYGRSVRPRRPEERRIQHCGEFAFAVRLTFRFERSWMLLSFLISLYLVFVAAMGVFYLSAFVRQYWRQTIPTKFQNFPRPSSRRQANGRIATNRPEWHVLIVTCR